MLKWLVILTAVASLRGEGLRSGPHPGEGQEHPERKQIKRFYSNANWFYPNLPYQQPMVYPFPTYQVVVHHVVMQSPTCQPTGQVPPYLPPFQPQPPVTENPNLTNRIGGGTTEAPVEEPTTKKPSKCVWAIVACCSPDSTAIRYSCFELLGCPGSFWGINPCKSEVVQAAANTALKYYMSGEEDD